VEYRLININNSYLRRKFINFPWKIYNKNSYWVPPLLIAEKERLDPRKNSFLKYGKISLYGVIDEGGSLAGRIASVYNPRHNHLFNRNDGFFGLFECIDNNIVAGLLINAVIKELKSLRVDTLTGPVTFTTNEETGLLIHGFDSSPAFMTNYCLPYYMKLLEGLGFTKSQDLFTYEWDQKHEFPDRFHRLINILSNDKEITLRKINHKNFDPEIQTVKYIYNNSFRDVWGFVPLDDNEVREMGKAFELFADFDLINFAFYKNKPVGFCMALPDINVAIKRLNGRLFPFGILKFLYWKRRIKSVRLNVIALLPEHRTKGIAALLIHNVVNKAIQNGYQKGEMSVIMESNRKITKLMDTLGFEKVKTYRVYQLAI
jgi:GNAT superfamily N-acetyltransferase